MSTATILVAVASSALEQLPKSTKALRERIAEVVAAMLPAHQTPPYKGEDFDAREEAFERLQNWAFCEGFAIVTEYSKATRI